VPPPSDIAALHRMLDANLNRAREGLRVLEDAARFALDDAALVARLKPLRHAISRVPDALAHPARLLASRDTDADVGTTIKTPQESSRDALPALISAASKRTTEALRVIEETLKVPGVLALATSVDLPRTIEHARYALYQVERDLAHALAARARRDRPAQWRICVLITESLCTLPWLDVARHAIDGGADCLQLREKSLDSADLLSRARALVALARQASTPVSIIINDRPDIALLARADGVHLGQTDLPITDVRHLARDHGTPDLLIGSSTHDLAEAHAAIAAGADYCGIGAMFTTTTKPRPTSGLAYLQQYLADPALAPTPHLAIGGISPDNIATLRTGGARAIAVSSCVCRASDPAAIVRSLRTALGH
jgi:thiamine-phosphate pyrophosphorylase